jgi:hypothetical protein
VTFKEILDDSIDRLTNGQPGARVRFRRFLNEWYRRILSQVSLPLGAETTLTTVAGTAEYSLPAAVGRVRGMQDESTRYVLRERSLDWMRQVDPDDTSEGNPAYYAFVTDRQIKLHPIPSANGSLTIDHESVVTNLDEDADIPIIPENFHYLLGVGIRINEYEKQDDAKRRKDAQAEMTQGINDLRFWIANRRRNVSNPGNHDGHTGPSRLGGWYPKGS